MDIPSRTQQDMLTNISESSTLVFLLRHGAEYLGQGRYIEAGNMFALAHAQLEGSEGHLGEILDEFIQKCTRYQSVQNTLLELSTQLVQAWTDLQGSSSPGGRLLATLIQNLETPPLPTNRVNSSKAVDAPPWDVAASQNQQENAISSTPGLVGKDTMSLPEFSITCFRRFEVRRSGKLLMLCSNRAGQAILRYLVTRPGHSATSDTLKALFWPEEEPEAAQRKLHHAISALRSSLRQGSSTHVGYDFMMYKNGLYSLDTAMIRLRTDVDEFLAYFQSGQKKSEERIALYEKACQLYTGPFLTEDLYADWSALQREQLSMTYFAMCRVLAAHYLQLKQYEGVVQWSTAILKENPCDENAHQQLIQTYGAQGYRSAAIQQYQLCERTLREELGIGPAPETTAILQKSIMTHMEQKRSENGEQT